MKPILALAGAVLLALAGVHLLTSGPGPVAHRSTAAAVARPAPAAGTPSSAPAPTAPPEVPLAGSSARPSLLSPSAGSAPSNPAPTEPRGLAPGDGPGADATVQHLLEQSSPPNLPTSQARSLETLGRQVWLADATGTGRTRWPQYFGRGGASGYTAVRVQAAIARADGARGATVTLLWAGTSPAADPQVALPATVRLTRQTNGTWKPTR